ncbi:hypothetical protein BJ508DRAFT_230147 [Ascobolus immersus RN42]|uniref:Uncharacterized protein n=1 Tax=Ascobolus immersus RN42 TaxID=1160509 RepID=A0A3N4I0I9_ASCIM|nr:hypothetical protein BJ508DRAFT_230147 [Ascobolus immersus RN42]
MLNIEEAVNYTLSHLTLDEKSYARDLLESEQYQGTKGHNGQAWLRAPVLHLQKSIAHARDEGQKRGFLATTNFLLYCDTLVVEKGAVLNPAGSAAMVVEIYARTILCSPQANGVCLDFDMSNRYSEVIFFTRTLPQDFKLRLRFRNDETVIDPVIREGKFGIGFYNKSDELEVEDYDPPAQKLENISYLDLINPDGTVKDKGYENDDYPRLLQFQILMASAFIEKDRQFALDLMNYVCDASATKYSVMFHYQANFLRNSLALQSDSSYVSSVPIHASKQVLKSRLTAALAFETAFRDFSLHTGGMKVQAMQAVNVLSKSNDALQTYDFIRSIRSREYDNALKSNGKAKAIFSTNQTDLETYSQRLRDGVEEWKKDQILKAGWEIFKGIFEVGIAIGATLATAGAAAPVAITAVATTVNTATKVGQMIAKLKRIFDKLKAIYEKIKPVLEKLQTVVKSITDLIANIRTFDAATQPVLKLDTKNDITDVFNATAEWDRFDITVKEMEDTLVDYSISGKEEFFRALKFLVINGKCYILTQANLVQKGDELATVLLQKKMEERNQDRLAATLRTIATDDRVVRLLTRAMFDRVLAIRSLVSLDFASYVSAYKFHSLQNVSPIELSPVKPIVDYLEDAARLQGAVTSFGGSISVQTSKFQLLTLCGFDTPEALAQSLQASGKAQVKLMPDDPVWRGFSRIRMLGIRTYLEGVRLRPEYHGDFKNVRLLLDGDAQFFDRDFAEENGGRSDERVSSAKSFFGAPQTFLFEYDADTRDVICDGVYAEGLEHTKQTPIRLWSVSLADSEYGIVPVSALDFESFKGIRFEFLCEFTLGKHY